MQNLVESIRLHFLLFSPRLLPPPHSPVSHRFIYAVRATNRRRKRLGYSVEWSIDRKKKPSKSLSCSTFTHVDCCSVVWCSRGMCFAGRPGPCAPLASFLPWMIPDPGRCGYQDLVQPLATTNTCCFPRLMSNNDNLLSSITPFSPSIFLLLLSYCYAAQMHTRNNNNVGNAHDHTNWMSWSEDSSPLWYRLVISLVGGFTSALELVQTRTTVAAICRILYQTHCGIIKTSTNCPAHIRVNPCRVSSHVRSSNPWTSQSFDLLHGWNHDQHGQKKSFYDSLAQCPVFSLSLSPSLSIYIYIHIHVYRILESDWIQAERKMRREGGGRERKEKVKKEKSTSKRK